MRWWSTAGLLTRLCQRSAELRDPGRSPGIGRHQNWNALRSQGNIQWRYDDVLFPTPRAVERTLCSRPKATRPGGEQSKDLASSIDGDQYQQPDRPWFASHLTVARALSEATIQETNFVSRVVLGYPLRC
jgi:hypothetical protein